MSNIVFALATEVYEEEVGLEVLLLLIFYAVPAILCYIIAKKYNRNKILWAILGLLFNFFALLILYFLFKPKNIEKSKKTNTYNRLAMSILGKWRFGDSHNGIFLEFYENETFRFYNNDSSLNFDGKYSLKGDILSVTVPGMGSDTIKIDEGMGNLNFLGKLFKRV